MVFALWLISGYELVRSLRDVDQRVSAGRDAFQRGQDVLTAVRTSVLLGSIYLRDALIDLTPANLEYYRNELIRVRADVERVLPDYLPLIGSVPEQEHWDILQVELGEYWQSREIVFSQDAPRTAEEAAVLLRQRLAPARESILEITDSLSALQRASRERLESEATLLYDSAQSRVISLASLAILGGFIVAFVAARQAGRLER